MFYIFILIALILSAFALSVFFGPPYVRTHKASVQVALDLMDIKKGSHVLDLGCGDGAVLVAAAKRGALATGYEINPILVLIAKWNTRQFGDKVRVRWGNMWKAQITDETQNIYMFLDVRFVRKVDKLIKASGAKVNLASYSYKLEGSEPVVTKDGINLYKYGN